jgi:hypothetical protein
VLRVISGVLGTLFLVPCVSGGRHGEHPYRYADVDIPISLAIGTVRTPEFPVAAQWYDIMVQVEKPLPFSQMHCMMAATSRQSDARAHGKRATGHT